MNELQQALNEMRNMRESYDQLGAAAEAYNTGKTELAANITSKGVQASASETLPELAEKVSAIAQESYTIDGGEMYAKQLYGSLTTPNYWNLYEVLMQLLSDGRLVQYGGILLAEYYRGYDSLALAGAGAGGAYVVSDKDEQGNFKMYTADTTHTWATEFDGKGNRWVAYCFADEYHDFQITDTNTSPRSIFIGKKVGNISALVSTRISQVVVTDGNELRRISGFDANWEKRLILRNLGICSRCIVNPTAAVELIYINTDKYVGSLSVPMINNITNVNTIIISCKEISCESGQTENALAICTKSFSSCQVLIIDGVESQQGNIYLNRYAHNVNYGQWANLKQILFTNVEQIHFMAGFDSATIPSNLKRLYISYKSNDRKKSVHIEGNANTPVNDVEVKEGWLKPLNVSRCNNLTEENIVNHILNKLGDNTGQSPLTITLGATNLAKLTAEEIAIATNKGFTLA